jgi:hypothetical protein
LHERPLERFPQKVVPLSGRKSDKTKTWSAGLILSDRKALKAGGRRGFAAAIQPTPRRKNQGQSPSGGREFPSRRGNMRASRRFRAAILFDQSQKHCLNAATIRYSGCLR